MKTLDRFFDEATSHGKLLAFVIVFWSCAICAFVSFLALWILISLLGFVPLSAGISGAIGCGIGSAIFPAVIAAIHA